MNQGRLSARHPNPCNGLVAGGFGLRAPDRVDRRRPIVGGETFGGFQLRQVGPQDQMVVVGAGGQGHQGHGHELVSQSQVFFGRKAKTVQDLARILFGGLDALADLHLLFAREQRHPAHLPQVHPHRIIQRIAAVPLLLFVRFILAAALNLGGVDAHGHDLFNDLTRLFIRVAAKLQMVAPILAAHIHPGLRREDFDLLTAPELFRIGQPSFYGEFSCRKALLQRGVPATEVHRWAANSCMGLMMPGEEFSDMWGVIFTFLLPLELALNHGRPFNGNLSFRLQTVSSEQYHNIAAILNTTIAYADELLSMLIKRHGGISAEEGANNPDPLVSALLCGGTPGRDRILGGPVTIR